MIIKEKIIEIIEADEWMMGILHTAKRLNLPDWWIAAGFVRSKVWDALHGITERTSIPDIDVIYFDNKKLDKSQEKKYESLLFSFMPEVPWSVKNEARMHQRNGLPPYQSSVDAISKFPETATAVGVKVDERGKVVLAAPHGIEDLVQLKVRPTPFFIESDERMEIYQARVQQKNWKETWGNLSIKL
ncbi:MULTISPECIES: nucleotidyltransferase family protein [Allobacillus]|uniref:Nucleotidyltransferase family protein n=1 Tax=Allobacillus salarius TaxID=1955272 RepID=A0A556PQT8_9BACI|nr:nucleotidyltransferase family protein [Allobacillus salarius]TSJ66755.1 nucleotidyltransferase family protein [Allobacillus salarius]